MSHTLHTKNIGSITVYGDALEGGYDGTKESLYATVLANTDELILPINPSTKPAECSMFISNLGVLEEVEIPTYTGGDLVYDGTQQEAVFDGIDTDKMTVSGLTATNAGTHIAVFTLQDGYKWADGGAWKQQIPWTIAKQKSALYLSDDAILLENAGDSYTVEVLGGFTDLTAVASDASLVSIAISGSDVTVERTSEDNGNIDVTIYDNSDPNTERKAILQVACGISVYGVEWLDGAQAGTRTDDAVDFEEPAAALANGDGSSPFDTLYPWSGMEIVEDQEAGTLVKIPKYYYKWEQDDTNKSRISIQIATAPKDGFLISPAHQDRGDGEGKRDFVYVSRYLSCTDYKSKTGYYPAQEVKYLSAYDGISALGEEVWQIDFPMFWTIAMLYLVEYANWNSQTTIGYGCGTSTNTVQINGRTNPMLYHTGTTASQRTSRGEVQYRYITDLWSNLGYWCDGILFSNASVYGQLNPAEYNTSGAAAVSLPQRSTANGEYIYWFSDPTTKGYEAFHYPVNTSSSVRYVPDMYYYRSDGSSVANRRIVLGAPYTVVNNYLPWFGLFRMGTNYSITSPGVAVGCRLMKLPKKG